MFMLHWLIRTCTSADNSITVTIIIILYGVFLMGFLYDCMYATFTWTVSLEYYNLMMVTILSIAE